VARAARITETMITVAAQAVAALSDARTQGASLLPPVSNLRSVSAAVAIAVARAAEEESLAQAPLDNLVQQVHQAMWRPQYPPFEAI
jgi:malate dehydrogenase (oxaloacetate-decarboxylating)